MPAIVNASNGIKLACIGDRLRLVIEALEEQSARQVDSWHAENNGTLTYFVHSE
jgi:hypothetical protein